jgi:small ligand-binding sensory domain FIST
VEERVGGIAGDTTGRGPYSVWSAGQQRSGRCENRLAGVRHAVGVSPGLVPLGPLLEDFDVDGFDLVRIGLEPAAVALARLMHAASPPTQSLSCYQALAVISDEAPEIALRSGKYRLAQVINSSHATGRVSLAGTPQEGEKFFFALRDTRKAQQEVAELASRLAAELNAPPSFGLVFPCMGRGPFFYGGRDEELLILRRSFPNLPFIGFYANGEFAHFGGYNRLLHYATVMALMA